MRLFIFDISYIYLNIYIYIFIYKYIYIYISFLFVSFGALWDTALSAVRCHRTNRWWFRRPAQDIVSSHQSASHVNMIDSSRQRRDKEHHRKSAALSDATGLLPPIVPKSAARFQPKGLQSPGPMESSETIPNSNGFQCPDGAVVCSYKLQVCGASTLDLS